MRQEWDRNRRLEGSTSRHWGFGLVGLLLGSLLGQGLWGGVSGAAIGLLLASRRDAEARLAQLENAVALIRSRPGTSPESAADGEGEDRAAAESTLRGVGGMGVDVGAGEPGEPGEATGMETPEPRAAAGPYAATAPPESQASVDEAASGWAASVDASAPPIHVDVSGAQHPPPRPPAPPSVFARGFEMLRDFLFGGNTVVRVGLLVLLVGLTLLAKYAAENALFPIEARLGFGALVGLGLVGFGFRQREARPGFGMSLQGGGLAALYVITFFAFKFYALIPAGLAFGLFVALAIATVMLSLLQKSEPLVVIGSLGGFLAPVLASTGGGSHVGLFSYYLVLISAIGLIAFRESWRIPSIVAFVCTYAVAGTWGVLEYDPSLFASTEPFVIAFMTLFTGIAFLHATRANSNLRGLVDGTLVFGTALVSITIQGALVRDMEMGLAFSAAGFGVFYLAWALLLWRRAEATFRPLSEAFLALAIGFVTMAIPFAFDEALTTSVAWALEGAGLYWVGIRQKRVLPRVAGYALQVLGALAFVASSVFDDIDASLFLPIANGRALSCWSLALAGIVIARMAYVGRDALRPFETALAQVFGIAGLAWWTGGSIAEIDQFVHSDWQVTAFIVWIAVTGLLLELGSERFAWKPGRSMALASLPAGGLALILAIDEQDHVLADGGVIAWPLYFATLHLLWQRMQSMDSAWPRAFRAGALWLAALAAAVMLSGLASAPLALTHDWGVGGFVAGLAGVLLAALWLEARGSSPFDVAGAGALRAGLGPIAGFALLAVLGVQFAADGDASPLPHVPLLNPVDLSVCLAALAVAAWWKRIGADLARASGAPAERFARLVFVMVGFVSLNGVLVRAVHQWRGVPLDADRLWASSAMHMTLSIAWTLIGLIGMLLASRRGWRAVWMGCAGLLGVVVVKLFTVDLGQLSTLSRIGTFLAVGAMLLVLGFFSPVPPARPETGTTPDESLAERSAS